MSFSLRARGLRAATRSIGVVSLFHIVSCVLADTPHRSLFVPPFPRCDTSRSMPTSLLPCTNSLPLVLSLYVFSPSHLVLYRVWDASWPGVCAEEEIVFEVTDNLFLVEKKKNSSRSSSTPTLSTLTDVTPLLLRPLLPRMSWSACTTPWYVISFFLGLAGEVILCVEYGGKRNQWIRDRDCELVEMPKKDRDGEVPGWVDNES